MVSLMCKASMSIVWLCCDMLCACWLLCVPMYELEMKPAERGGGETQVTQQQGTGSAREIKKQGKISTANEKKHKNKPNAESLFELFPRTPTVHYFLWCVPSNSHHAFKFSPFLFFLSSLVVCSLFWLLCEDECCWCGKVKAACHGCTKQGSSGNSGTKPLHGHHHHTTSSVARQ